MRVKCRRTFRDFDAGRIREEGEEFEVTPDRLKAINGTKYGLLVDEVKEDVGEPTEDKLPADGENVTQKRPQRRRMAKPE